MAGYPVNSWPGVMFGYSGRAWTQTDPKLPVAGYAPAKDFAGARERLEQIAADNADAGHAYAAGGDSAKTCAACAGGDGGSTEPAHPEGIDQLIGDLQDVAAHDRKGEQEERCTASEHGPESDAAEREVAREIAARIVSIAEAKTIANEALGVAGMVSVFVKAILCNWMVTLGVVMAMTSQSTPLIS